MAMTVKEDWATVITWTMMSLITFWAGKFQSLRRQWGIDPALRFNQKYLNLWWTRVLWGWNNM